jgi:hypothetical protein
VSVQNPAHPGIGGVDHGVGQGLGGWRLAAFGLDPEPAETALVDAHQIGAAQVAGAAGLARGDDEPGRIGRVADAEIAESEPAVAPRIAADQAEEFRPPGQASGSSIGVQVSR